LKGSGEPIGISRKEEDMFGRMTVDRVLNVTPGCESGAALKALLKMAGTPTVTKWIDFPEFDLRGLPCDDAYNRSRPPFAGWLYEPETPAESLRVPQRFTSNYSGRKVERICGRVLHMPFAAERWSGGTLRFSHIKTHTRLGAAARFTTRRYPQS